MDSSRRVLVIGGASDTETVLKAVLEPRGATVERSRLNRTSERNQSSPEVVVIDLDTESEAGAVPFQWSESKRVLIGSDHPSTIASKERFLSKPFQFPELVKVIEELLNSRPAA